jgi:hypothetical protein
MRADRKDSCKRERERGREEEEAGEGCVGVDYLCVHYGSNQSMKKVFPYMGIERLSIPKVCL